jgi:hypothetical protein
LLHSDRIALVAITSAMPQEIMASPTMKETVVEAWEATKSMGIGSESVWNARVQRL